MSNPFLSANFGAGNDSGNENTLGSVSVPNLDDLIRTVRGIASSADSPARSDTTSPVGLSQPLSILADDPLQLAQTFSTGSTGSTRTTPQHTPHPPPTPPVQTPEPQCAWVCTGCLRQIKDASLGQMVGDRAWHTQCMVCEVCGVRVGSGGVPVHRSGAALYCFQHKMSARRCRGCDAVVHLTGAESHSALRVAESGDLWHSECCTCATCGSTFQSGSTLRVVGGQTYCEEHFAALSLVCAMCTLGLWANESYVKQDNKTWHATCAPEEMLK
ncbi:hypothetical protein SARC_12257 [Sphaeroforma arctica JP610]|uniref:LIM zinc-binding domain-containing protein n=1 Tax=Sphaeroforma arctica JP610 TaxID=667725 RepID=A0A0L0FEM3_9EUKA|nr:hypothetical protein SARC_12257 [Sphaeroforma arctica JP610]KNC75214.1 hypothetical protein SARC_12257 [Sphaeroforma arctica JP610]|eukprot:XP_014149116.1 hypothetical protein SARC_12257 [Sphaeroforma arctica JP610]